MHLVNATPTRPPRRYFGKIGECILRVIGTGMVAAWCLGLGLCECAAATDTVPKESSSQLPPEVRKEWERQKAALSSLYLEFTTTNRGTLPQWNYASAPAVSGYLEGGHFYLHEVIPGDDRYEVELAFDGQNVWRRSEHRVTKTPLEDAQSQANYRMFRWYYLEAAGLYAPAYPSELKGFSSLEPLGLHFLETGAAIQSRMEDGKLRITFQVEDQLAALQLKYSSGKKSVEARREVTLLLEPQFGYRVVEIEGRNVLGQRVESIRPEAWKYYEAAGLWLPGRTVASYYARPWVFLDNLSDQPVHVISSELRRAEFGRKDIPVRFETSPAAVSKEHLFDPPPTSVPTTNAPPQVSTEPVDIATIDRIKAEVLRHSEVMDIASWLCDVFGPRLTGSPNTRDAANWAVARMQSWGVDPVYLDPWEASRDATNGPRTTQDRGWTTELFTLRAVTPRPFMIHAMPLPWSPGTPGRITGPAVRIDVHSFAGLQQYAGKLKGALLLKDAPLATAAHFEPEATRLSDARLKVMSETARPERRSETVESRYDPVEDPAARTWLVKEGVAALLFVAPGDSGTIQLAGHGSNGSRTKDEPDALPAVKVAAEDYGRLARIVEKDLPVTLELEMRNTFHEHPDEYNIIAEIPGTDPKLKDEVVMFGAHLDSWTFGTGATDNGAGVAMLMEMMRILKTLHLQPRRTILIALFTGEEQGTLGSVAYVKKHLSTESDLGRFSVFFNLDGGTGKIRGVWRQQNKAAGEIFRAWMIPFQDLGMKTISAWEVGGGDDLAFMSAGLPSFGFIQDPIDYDPRTHHTSADVYERLLPDDLKFNTAVLAAFAWQAAQRDGKIPRDGKP